MLALANMAATIPPVSDGVVLPVMPPEPSQFEKFLQENETIIFCAGVALIVPWQQPYNHIGLTISTTAFVPFGLKVAMMIFLGCAFYVVS